MFLSTQMQTPFGSSQNIYQRLVRRMTRFFTNTDSKTTERRLKRVFEKRNYNYKTSTTGQLTVTTKDKRRMPLVFSASVIDMNSCQILVDFRLTKGDGIEFKRHFVSIRNDLKDMIVKGPITWPLAFATNSLP
ncbi:unnamed protein product [Oppiella nova]|uniref:Uncharacterized protein n=1 Tax=Oppiella nova TaxID=334625 RepID=A0A7R9R0R6_9ACAR|nr:unnamed protein product [Oppiella nova]CAG2181278.1 unnamed protein product [Oppiella nova]